VPLEFTRVEGRVTKPTLTIYSISYCEFCKEAKSLLHEAGYAYRYLFVDLLPPADQFTVRKTLDRPGVKSPLYPVLEIEGQEDRIYGFNREVWAARLGISTASPASRP
jgi:glutaredoxin